MRRSFSRNNPNVSYGIYLKSGIWKCEKSPTGIHYWIIEHRKGQCKYCGRIRKLDNRGQFDIESELADAKGLLDITKLESEMLDAKVIK